MSHFIYLLFYILNVINAYSKKKSKALYVIFFVLMLLMFSEVTKPNYNHPGAYSRGDNELYQVQYENYRNVSNISEITNMTGYDNSIRNVELGYSFISFAFAKAGIPYNIYRAITFLICSLLVIVTFSQISNNYSYFLSLYFLYCFLFDIQQIRNFIAISIIIFSFKYLISGKVVRYIACVIIASLFHFTAIIFLLFLIVLVKDYDKLSKLFIQIGVALTLVLAAMNVAGINIMKQISGMFLSGSYISDRFNVLRPFIQLILFDSFAYITSRLKDEHPDDEWTRFIFMLNAISFLFVPLMFISMTMDGLCRPVLLMDYILFSKYLSLITYDRGKLYLDKTSLYNIIAVIAVIIMYFTFTGNLIIWIFDSNNFIFLLDKLLK